MSKCVDDCGGRIGTPYKPESPPKCVYCGKEDPDLNPCAICRKPHCGEHYCGEGEETAQDYGIPEGSMLDETEL